MAPTNIRGWAGKTPLGVAKPNQHRHATDEAFGKMISYTVDHERIRRMKFRFANVLRPNSWRWKGREFAVSTLFVGLLATLGLVGCGITSIRQADSSNARMSEADAIATLANGPLHIDGNNLFPLAGSQWQIYSQTRFYIEYHKVKYSIANADKDKLLRVINVTARGISYYSWEYNFIGGYDVDVHVVPRFVAFDSITKIDVDKNHSFQSYPDEVIALFSHGEVAARFLVAAQEKGQERSYISALLALCHNVK